MAKLVVLIGSPGSGKSERAYDLEKEGYCRINQDDQDMCTKGWHLTLFQSALSLSANIVIDRMGFSKEQRLRYVKPALELGYDVAYEVMATPMEECFKRAIERQGHPTIKTKQDASRAINFFFSKYEPPTKDEGYTSLSYPVNSRFPIIEKKPAIICDLDGTLCNVDHRLHFVRRESKKDWKSFSEGLTNDTINPWCNSIIDNFKDTHKIILMSGRSENYKKITLDWLHSNNVYYDELHMRHRNDSRDDSIVKEILYTMNVMPKYDVQFCIDDRPKICRKWRELGLICLQCQDKEF